MTVITDRETLKAEVRKLRRYTSRQGTLFPDQMGELVETGGVLSLINGIPELLGAPGLSPEEVSVLEFYADYGPMVYSHEGCNCADCQTGRKWATNIATLRALIARAKAAQGTPQEGKGERNG